MIILFLNLTGIVPSGTYVYYRQLSWVHEKHDKITYLLLDHGLVHERWRPCTNLILKAFVIITISSRPGLHGIIILLLWEAVSIVEFPQYIFVCGAIELVKQH